MSEMIKIRIYATQEVAFDKTVEMTKADYDELNQLYEDEDNANLSDVLSNYLSAYDIMDASDYEVVDIRVVTQQAAL